MSTQNIVERILSDADVEARLIVENAERKAAQTLAASSARAEKLRMETEADVRTKTGSILEKKAADARLESAKILLGEKRKVVDSVYALALNELIALGKEDCVRLFKTLLEKYAEEGDEVFFAENFRYVDEVKILPVIEKKGLKISEKRLPLDGGMRLIGQISDKDLSFGALLAHDRDNNQSALAAEIFD